MKSLDNIAEDLFNKIRGRFPSVTIGDKDGKVTTDPITARFFDFDYKENGRDIGKVSISVSEDKLSVMYSNSFVENEDTITRQNWYNFLKELRTFAKKRLLQFDTRDITKSNLDKRDYKFLARQQGGETTMSESKLYGTGKVSYQNIGNSRLNIRHTQHVNPDLAASRTQHIDKIYIESADGERFMYPFRHLNGARAMARHVSEGGKPFDDFGKHITGLSEELANLRKFKNYMGRSSVMAESLAGYMDAVAERIQSVKKTIEGLQKESHYKEAFESFQPPVMEEVPADVVENWIDQLTIRQFNEELKDVFPYVYKLVSEVSKAKEIGPEDITEGPWDDFKSGVKQIGKAAGDAMFGSEEEDKAQKTLVNYIVKQTGDRTAAGRVLGTCKGNELECLYSYIKEKGLPETPEVQMIAKQFNLTGKANMQVDDVESAIDDLMGQFSDKPKAAPKKPQTPMTEFILSLFDRNTGEFPKGETAVLTSIEKDYGEQYITPAKAFIERIRETFDQYQMEANPQQMQPEMEISISDDSAFDDMKRLAGLR